MSRIVPAGRRAIRLASGLLAVLLVVQTAHGALVAIAETSLPMPHGVEPLAQTAVTREDMAPRQGAGEFLADAISGVAEQLLWFAGWEVLDVHTQLADAVPPGALGFLSGSGSWTVLAAAEDGQLEELAGVFNFQLEGRQRLIPPGHSSEVSGTFQLTGTLRSASVGMTIYAYHMGARSGAHTEQRLELGLTIDRAEVVQTFEVRAARTITPLAPGTFQSDLDISVIADQDEWHWIETDLAVDLGHGQSEHWLEGTLGARDPGIDQIAFNQHYFHYETDTEAARYIDELEAEFEGVRYRLAAPATIGAALGSDVEVDIELVPVEEARTPPLAAYKQVGGGHADVPYASGLHDGKRATADPPGLHSLMLGPCDFASWALSSGTSAGIAGLGDWAFPNPSPLPGLPSWFKPDGFGGVNKWSGWSSSLLSSLLAWGIIESLGVTDPVGQMGISFGVSLAMAGLAGGLAGVAFGIATGVLGEMLSAGIDALVDRYCMADPQFSYPDIRPADNTPSDHVLDVLPVRGGLAQQPDDQRASADNGEADATWPVDEHPEYLVGGSIPQGTEGIGPWEWDDARAFGAIPSHTQAPEPGLQQHYFLGPDDLLLLGPDDNIVQYVFLDPDTPPEQLLLQFYVGDGDGERRAYWGQNLAQTGGIPGTQSLMPMGLLPRPGEWIRLKIPAHTLGLDGQALTGMLFGAVNGQTWWGPTTVSNRLTDGSPDVMSLPAPLGLPGSDPGASIPFWLRVPAAVTLEIIDAESGETVRTLLADEAMEPGFRVEQWDGMRDDGSVVEGAGFAYRFLIDGAVAAEGNVGLTPLVAELISPSPHALVRGTSIPIIGNAYGEGFSEYVLEYGAGLEPVEWLTIAGDDTPKLFDEERALSGHTPLGNLAEWSVGLDEYGSYRGLYPSGLNGVYTLRLRVVTSDGTVQTDTVPVIVGRLASAAHGGLIESPDGRARLVIDPLSIDSYTVNAVIPLVDLEPDRSWEDVLPPTVQLAGDVYELFPGNAAFRWPVTLELPLAVENPSGTVGVLIGNGAAEGWKYAGGVVDPERDVIVVSLTELGGGRVIAAPFVGESFEAFPRHPGVITPDQPTADADSLTIRSESHPVAFVDDFQVSTGEWRAFGGTAIEVVQGEDVGLPIGESALAVRRMGDMPRLVQVRASPFDATEFPILAFDYRLTGTAGFNILVRSNGTWWQLEAFDQRFTGDPAVGVVGIPAPGLLGDGEWHAYHLDLLSLLRFAKPAETEFVVDEILLGVVHNPAWGQADVADPGGVHDAYYIDNFAALRPSRNQDIQLTWEESSGPEAAEYRYDVVSTSSAATSEPRVTTDQQVVVALGADDPDGLWIASVQARDAGGNWTAAARYPILIDREPPEMGLPLPEPGGAGPASHIRVPVSDPGGIDLSSLQVEIEGDSYPAGVGIRYATLGVLAISPFRLEPAPAIVPGSPVNVQVAGLADYAGNAMPEALSWSFVATLPQAEGTDLHPVTGVSATSPALSPDGQQLAFVADRSGVPGVWIVPVEDIGSAGTVAVPLDTGASTQADPAWSPDGELIAFVADDGSGPRLWVSTPGGAEARPLSPPAAQTASPAWSPDGQVVAFIRDGNLWQVRRDGTGLFALTTDAERPYRSVSWQPGGQLLAVHFSLYEDAIRLFDLRTGEFTSLTSAGRDHSPAWLDRDTVLFSAPAAPGEPDVVWSIEVDGSGRGVLAGSGLPGIADTGAAVAADGSVLAIVSTRGGELGVWLRETRRIGAFGVGGERPVTPGEPLAIDLAVTADATVTLRLIDPAGGDGIVLADGLPAVQGANTLAIAPTLPDGTSLPPGTYVLKATVETSDGETMEQLTTLRVAAAEDIGTLAVSIDLWPGEPAADIQGLVALVYLEGDRDSPVAELRDEPRGTFDLSPGRYDVIVTYGASRRVLPVTIAAGDTTEVPVDLGLSRIAVAITCATDVELAERAVVTVARMDGSAGGPVATLVGASAEVLVSPGDYDVRVAADGRTRTLRTGGLAAGDVSTHDVELCIGSARLSVLISAGIPADPASVRVRAYPVGESGQVADAVGNPAELELPEGRYDLQLDYQPAGASVIYRHWYRGVEIANGETRDLLFNLGHGKLTIEIRQSAGVENDADRTTVSVYRENDRSVRMGFLSSAGTHMLDLPAGFYNIVTTVAGIDGETRVEVRPGEEIVHVVDLGIGSLHVGLAGDGGFFDLEVGARIQATVYRVAGEDSADILDPPVASSENVPAEFQLPGGTYVVVLEGILPLDGAIYADERDFRDVSAPLVVTPDERTDHLVDVRSGRLRVSVVPGDAVSGLLSVFTADQGELVAMLENGVERQVPFGTYDIRIGFFDSEGAFQDAWIEGVVVEPGAVVEIEHRLEPPQDEDP